MPSPPGGGMPSPGREICHLHLSSYLSQQSRRRSKYQKERQDKGQRFTCNENSKEKWGTRGKAFRTETLSNVAQWPVGGKAGVLPRAIEIGQLSHIPAHTQTMCKNTRHVPPLKTIQGHT